MIENKKILITGGAGFIGTNLCGKLCRNNEILIYDNLKRNSIIYTNLLQNKNIYLIVKDILDGPSLKSAVEDFEPDIVIHCAAVAGVESVVTNPVETVEVNILGTLNILEALKDYTNRIERFIDFSSSEVFGPEAYKCGEYSSAVIPPPKDNRWSYAVSKLTGEHLTFLYEKMYGLKTVLIRPFNVYGPGQVGESAMHSFIVNAINGKDIIVNGSGSQIRSWCYIDDFTDGVILCIEKKEAAGHIFNLGCEEGIITINELAERVKAITDSSSRILHRQNDSQDVQLRIPDTASDYEILGFRTKTKLADGIQKTAEWYKQVYSKYNNLSKDS